MRNVINLWDLFYFKFWRFCFKAGYRIRGFDYWSRKLQRTPERYLIKVLNSIGSQVDCSAVVKSGIILDNLRGIPGLTIGKRAYLGPGVFLDLAAPITIEEEAVLAPQAMILTHGDVGDRMLSTYIKRREGPVILKKGCWIGARAVILPGITVGQGAVVGAGAVVSRDVPEFTVVAGVPAREIRKITGIGD